jgi:hypothetical protein
MALGLQDNEWIRTFVVPVCRLESEIWSARVCRRSAGIAAMRDVGRDEACIFILQENGGTRFCLGNPDAQLGCGSAELMHTEE